MHECGSRRRRGGELGQPGDINHEFENCENKNANSVIAEQTERLRKLFLDLGQEISEADARDSVTLFWKEPAMHPSSDIDKREIQAPILSDNRDEDGVFHEAGNEKYEKVAGRIREIFHDIRSEISEVDARESKDIFINEGTHNRVIRQDEANREWLHDKSSPESKEIPEWMHDKPSHESKEIPEWLYDKPLHDAMESDCTKSIGDRIRDVHGEEVKFPIKIGNMMVSEEDFFKIKKQREAGLNITTIADEFGINNILLSAYLKKCNIKRLKERDVIISGLTFSREELDLLFDRRRNGELVKTLAEEFDIDEARLVKVFQKFGIGIDDKQAYMIENIAFPKEKVQELIERRRNGEKVRDLATEIGVKENDLTWFFKRHDVKPRIDDSAIYLAGKALTEEQFKEIVGLRCSGWTYKDLGEKCGVNQSAIFNLLKRNSMNDDTITKIEQIPVMKETKQRNNFANFENREKEMITIDGKSFTRQEIEEMIEKRQKGIKLQPLADEISVNRRALQKFLSRGKIGPVAMEGTRILGNVEIPDEILSEIVKKRMDGESIRSLAEQYDINKDTLRRYLVATGNIPPASILRDVNRTYKINHEFFGEPQVASNEEAYILGLIMTDGSLTKTDKTIEICLNRKDQYLLEKINKILSSDRPLYLPKKEGDNRAMLHVNSLTMYNDLQRKGIDVATKSYTAKFPDLTIVPKNFQGQFIRGLFDGDGWISINKDKCAYTWGFVGTRELVTGVQKVLMERCNLSKTKIFDRKESNVCFRFGYCGGNNVGKIHEFIYGPYFDPEKDLCLTRKWEKMKYVYDQYIKKK